MIDFSRRQALLTGLAGTGLVAAGGKAQAPMAAPEATSRWTLWYRQPATRWVEALAVGNGRIGAMAYGGTTRERLQLNEDSLWAGGPYDPSNPSARAALPRVRKLIEEERFKEAQDLAQAEMMARPIRQMSYQTLGELLIDLPGEADGGYRRWLDLDAATTVTEWRQGNRLFRRTVFASAPDQVIAVRIEAVGGGAVAAVLRFAAESAESRGDTLVHTGRNGDANGVAGALRYAVGVRALGGHGRIADGTLHAEGDGAVTLLIAARTSYRNWRDVSGDPEAAVLGDLDKAARHAPDALLARHQTDHRRLFRGFELDLGADPFPGIATDERIRYSHDTGRDDPFLAALYVQYGRYLLIASSRRGAQPANLQGLWNESRSPPWGSKYTININTQMNYWPAEPTGLGECVEPLIAMVEDLAESGARTARTNYGARGWVAHHNTDLWRATAPIDGAFYGMWPTGGAWLCKHLWDRWDYSRDPKLLGRIYPVMRDCGLFFLDTLVEHGGGLVTSPSISPENAHHTGVSICAGPAMDRQILRELFGNIITASERLGRDAGMRKQFAAALSRIPADRIGKAGQLQEWLEDWDLDAPEIQHRHVSHLYALYPGHEIEPGRGDLYGAARRSLSIRGDDATGWGIGWRINLWARLGDGERAYTVLRKLLGPDRTYPNLFDAHPPFQIDGNFGGAAGIVEMIVRDQPDRVTLLPALPKAWPRGRLTGVRLRGGLILDLAWQEGALAEATVRASGAVEREFAYGPDVRTLAFAPGQTQAVGAHL
ncbi:glycoside hydrolase N-terminal domain-containing protein [Sphingosinicella sp. BN140058]|uniref:glycoside hydrolase family 95 protein n=1 Tax=Sphingosinicella sp. BN140058 TaxID=1892855 RepID=UPI001011BD00|nr:glycoside hydrolase family 95 protein [Sphingosinicella sp. BN140058]QAY79548.1 glycoside hydrolase family 95 protein [Sphingosinicella sp. BN140058]